MELTINFTSDKETNELVVVLMRIWQKTYYQCKSPSKFNFKSSFSFFITHNIFLNFPFMFLYIYLTLEFSFLVILVILNLVSEMVSMKIVEEPSSYG